MAGIRVSFTDFTGKTVGHLAVARLTRTIPRKQSGRVEMGREYIWLCRCVCGKELEIRHRYLMRGLRTNCGCKDVPSQVTHGATRHGLRVPEHRIWAAMRERCENPHSKNFKNYGAIGRTVCDRWKSYANFIVDMGPRPTAKHTLERSDNNRGYSPDNCRWATRKEQMRNVSYNRNLTFSGRTQCMSAWAEELGVDVLLIWKRLNRGWSVERALTTPKMTNQFG